MKILKSLFCRHDYHKIDWREEIEDNLAYSVRLYKCAHCGKEIWVDGRYDPYE